MGTTSSCSKPVFTTAPDPLFNVKLDLVPRPAPAATARSAPFAECEVARNGTRDRRSPGALPIEKRPPSLEAQRRTPRPAESNNVDSEVSVGKDRPRPRPDDSDSGQASHNAALFHDPPITDRAGDHDRPLVEDPAYEPKMTRGIHDGPLEHSEDGARPGHGMPVLLDLTNIRRAGGRGRIGDGRHRPDLGHVGNPQRPGSHYPRSSGRFCKAVDLPPHAGWWIPIGGQMPG